LEMNFILSVLLIATLGDKYDHRLNLRAGSQTLAANIWSDKTAIQNESINMTDVNATVKAF